MFARFSAALMGVSVVFHGGQVLAHPCERGAEQIPQNALVESRAGFQVRGEKGIFRLADVHVPDPAPLPQKARLAGRASTDRYGRRAAHVFDKSGWFQGRLLQQGRALLVVGEADGDCLTALREAEAQARTAGRGVWRQPQHRLRADETEAMANFAGRFVVVTGPVASVGDRKKRLYLNFGQNWSQDFTVSVVKSGRGAFKERQAGALARFQALTGKTVRVRGVLEQRQGPLIRLADEAQIEILD
ncbi:MAG: thermonuclease family protein [Pseudomonadota bacterium]